MAPMETRTYSVQDIASLATSLVAYASEQKNETGATVLALSGNLGAGKTTLVQHVASELGVDEVVTSPTFVVMKRYETTHLGFTELIHIDAYRIEQATEMVVLGFLEWLKNPHTLICIEWPEKISTLIPKGAIAVSLMVVDDTQRKISYG